LENILERALTLCENNTILREDLQLPSMAAQDANSDDVLDEAALGYIDENDIESGIDLEDHLDRIEKEAITKALQRTRYNKTAAAKLLGMSFRSLRYRLKKLGMDDIHDRDK